MTYSAPVDDACGLCGCQTELPHGFANVLAVATEWLAGICKCSICRMCHAVHVVLLGKRLADGCADARHRSRSQ